MIKIVFLNQLRYGERTKLDQTVLKLLNNNSIDYMQVGADSDYNYVISDQDTYFLNRLSYDKIKSTEIDPFKIITYSKCWNLFSGSNKLSEEGLFDVFKQCVSGDESSKKMGFDILYKLNGNIYFHIQSFVARYVTSPALVHSNFEIFKDLNNLHIAKNNGLPISFNLVDYVNKFNVNGSQPEFLNLCKKVFNLYPVCVNKYIQFKCSLSEDKEQNFDISAISV